MLGNRFLHPRDCGERFGGWVLDAIITIAIAKGYPGKLLQRPGRHAIRCSRGTKRAPSATRLGAIWLIAYECLGQLGDWVTGLILTFSQGFATLSRIYSCKSTPWKCRILPVTCPPQTANPDPGGFGTSSKLCLRMVLGTDKHFLISAPFIDFSDGFRSLSWSPKWLPHGMTRHSSSSLTNTHDFCLIVKITYSSFPHNNGAFKNIPRSSHPRPGTPLMPVWPKPCARACMNHLETAKVGVV